ncbi:MAG: VWA domain-containing protein [Chloroflexi bacterium]|nr:VWA domain-containing protein [Chloroflexota bacterium]
MSFGQPQWLILLLAAPIVGLLFWYYFRWKERASARFGDPTMMRHLTASTLRGRQRIKAALLVAAASLLALAAARPSLGLEEEVETRVGTDFVVALDVSLGMTATDVAPNRLAWAKREVVGLIDRLQGDRIGIVLFARTAQVHVPLTTDLEAARTLVQAVEADAAPQPGTALAEAARTALTLMDPEEERDRVLVLVSDGEDLEGGVEAAAQAAGKAGVPIFTIGVGTARGSTIPLKDAMGRPALKTDRSGQVVVTRLEEDTLRMLALATDGRSYLATSGQGELDRLYAEVARRGRATVTGTTVSRPRESFQVFALIAFLALAVEWLVTERRKEPQ